MSDLKLTQLLNDLHQKSERRFDGFSIEEIGKISRINEDAYLKSPTWLGGDEEFVCVFIDLDDSSKISNIKQRSTVAKIYDYFTQNVVDIMSHPEMSADYIDIKGDGVFGIFEGEKAVFKAFAVAVTFKTFFEKFVSDKFKDLNLKLYCKISITQDKILVKKIGKINNYNEVWAGRLINNAFKVAALNDDINKRSGTRQNLVIVSQKIYERLHEKKNEAILSCGHEGGKWTGNKSNLWHEHKAALPMTSKYSEPVYYLFAVWCEQCGGDYLNELIN